MPTTQGYSGDCRQKHWSEIDDAEKIKRLRLEVKRLTNWIYEIVDMLEPLCRHDHLNGKIVFQNLSKLPSPHLPLPRKDQMDMNEDRYF